jgi:hypothetical protein
MYHPLLMQPEVLRELPALLEDLRPRVAEPAVLSYRSEAFAEDLAGDGGPAPQRAPLGLLLTLAPAGLVLLGAALLGMA